MPFAWQGRGGKRSYRRGRILSVPPKASGGQAAKRSPGLPCGAGAWTNGIWLSGPAERGTRCTNTQKQAQSFSHLPPPCIAFPMRLAGLFVYLFPVLRKEYSPVRKGAGKGKGTEGGSGRTALCKYRPPLLFYRIKLVRRIVSDAGTGMPAVRPASMQRSSQAMLRPSVRMV